jgi:type IV pilus assembly protein PilC
MAKNKQTLSAEELSAFSSQLSLTVRTGIPLSESIMILQEDAETPAAGKLLGEILETLELGEPLASALRKTGVFPLYMIQMIEIGESAGRLDQVLEELTKYYARQDNISKSVRSAVTYPAIMLLILVAIVLVLVIKVLPIFNEVFNSLGGELSPIAQGAMSVGQAISDYSVVIIIAIAVIAILIFVMRFTKKGREIQASIGRKLARKLTKQIASGRFASGMSLMLASGVDINKGVELTLPMMEDPQMQDKVSKLKDELDAGGSFSESVVKTGIFSGLEARILTLGFRSGNMEEVMSDIADKYERNVDDRLDHLISVIEPTMVAILCVVVGLILLSSMLPLLAVMSSIV